MEVILYLLGIVAVLMLLQTAALRALGEPLQWSFGAHSRHPPRVKLALKVVLHGTLVGSLVLYPYLVGTTPAAFYGQLLPLRHAPLFFVGQLLGVTLLAAILALETSRGWLYWKPRFPPGKALRKSLLSVLSSLTVVAVEEPLFRGILLGGLLGALPWLPAVVGSAVLFSLAHFIKKRSTYWPMAGLTVLGLWLGVAYYKTGTLWLPMGLHSGGILAIGIHRCYLNYRAPEWLVGTQTFPIAGAVSMAVMAAGTLLTWILFR